MTLNDRLQALRDKWERLSQRERTMVGALGVTFALLVTLIVGYVISDGLATLEERNADMRQALHELETGRDAYLRMKAKTAQAELRMGQTPVQLNSYLETASKEAGIEIPESNERSQPTSNKAFVERTLDIGLRNVTLEQLTKFMRAVENGRNMVIVSQINVRTRDDKHDTLDVEMSVSTYERAKDGGKGAKKGEDK